MELKHWLSLGAILLFLAVAAGAFGAHALRGRVEPQMMEVYEKAVFYHFVHALGVLIVCVLALTKTIDEAQVKAVLFLLVFGIVFFSGSLYALALSGIRILGAITPIGGMAFLLAWALLAWRSVTGIEPRP